MSNDSTASPSDEGPPPPPGRPPAVDPSATPEDTAALLSEAAAEVGTLERDVAAYEVTRLLSGPYDRGGALLPRAPATEEVPLRRGLSWGEWMGAT